MIFISRSKSGIFYVMIISREITVKGEVQGVNFRHYTREQAIRLGILGTVRNCADGTVVINAQGEEHDMDTFMKWCFKGPSRAMVVGLEVAETGAQDYESFEIIR